MQYLRTCKPNWNKINNIANTDYIKFTNKDICSRKLPYSFIKSYDNLPIDKYLENNNPPTRFRRFSKYVIHPYTNNIYHIYHDSCNVFKQNVKDSRGDLRRFELLENKFIKDKWLLEMLTNISGASIMNTKKEVYSVNITLHQVRQLAYPNSVGAHNSPEGIHRDGADYIVSAFVLNRKNVTGGESIIYNENKKQIYKTTLNNNYGIFQEDQKSWHYVTPIQSRDNKNIGLRDIIGLDISLD